MRNWSVNPAAEMLDMKDRVEDFDEYLDDMENEENIYYGCPSIEEELFDDYKMFIDEMDLE